MPHIIRMYVEVIRGYYVDLAVPDEEAALAQVYDMSIEDIEQQGEVVYCDTGDHAHIIDEFDEEDQHDEPMGG